MFDTKVCYRLIKLLSWYRVYSEKYPYDSIVLFINKGLAQRGTKMLLTQTRNINFNSR